MLKGLVVVVLRIVMEWFPFLHIEWVQYWSSLHFEVLLNDLSINIKNSLNRFEKVKKEKDYQIKITSKLNKITIAKDLKGSATDFKIVTSLDLEVIKNNNIEKIEKVSFTENFAIKKTDSNYEQNNYEIIVINNLSKLLLDQVVMYLSTNRW